MKKIFWKIGLVAAVALCFVFSGAVSAMAATPTWMKLSIGAMNTVGVKSNGSLWAWGNYSGTGGYAQASPMECLVGTTWNDVAAGDNCDFAIKSDGTLWAWGDNTYGQLGIGSTDAQQAAVQVGISTNWASIYAGPCNTFAIQKDGSLWAWGDNTNDQLGIGTSNRALSTPPPAAGTVVVSSPVRVGTDTNWKSVAILDGAVLGLKTDGSLWAWGNNSAGVFGNGNSDMEGMSADSKIPLRIGTANDWATLSAGAAHVVALKTNGTLWTWGMNSEGEVGAGDTTLLHPTATQLGTATWKYAMAGALSTVAVKSDGTLWTWGFNGYGTNNLGTGLTDTYVTSPTQIQGASNWISVVSGNGRSLGLKSDNTLWGWGNWPVGDGTNEDRTVPVLIFDKSMLVDLTSLTNSASGPVLKWTPFPNATGYRIYRNAVEIAEVGPGGLSSYTDTKAVSGMSYGYSICAYTGNIYNQTGSILDNTLTITYLAQPTLTSLTNSATGPLLTWTRSKGATGYYIYRKVPGGAFARI
ncbi:MAG: hypothetical protein FWF45_08165, partial [Coriobacteriia bacterium]|nr:hypothetical protein [Coriobacteriia bacterium]